VRVDFLVGEGVVVAVVSDPGDDIALQGQAAGDRQPAPQPPLRFERTVSEIAVEPDRHAQARKEVKAHRETDIEPVQAPIPGQRNGRQQSQHRTDDEDIDKNVLTKGTSLGKKGFRADVGWGLGASVLSRFERSPRSVGGLQQTFQG
jgi:hypothetical protein